MEYLLKFHCYRQMLATVATCSLQISCHWMHLYSALDALALGVGCTSTHRWMYLQLHPQSTLLALHYVRYADEMI